MTKNKEIMCEECFAIIEECDCEIVEVKKNKKEIKTKGEWSPNIKPNEKWFKVESPFKPYKLGE